MAGDNVDAVRHPVLVMRAQPFVRLIALVFSIVGIAAFFRLGTHRDVIRAPESPPEASAMSPELVATAHAQSEVVPETRLLHDSGVISFEASTVHASAVQSLVAISVKRLPATSRGDSCGEWNAVLRSLVSTMNGYNRRSSGLLKDK